MVRVDGNRAAQGIQRFRSGRLLPSPESKSETRQHSRRSAADCCSLTRGPPHSTSPLALADVQKVAQNHGGFCQNLGRPLASSDRIFATKCSCVCEFQCQEILQKSLTNGSESTKIHQNEPKWRPSKKNSPQDRKRPKKRQEGKKIGSPWAFKISQNRKRRGVENRYFFRPRPGTDFASF